MDKITGYCKQNGVPTNGKPVPVETLNLDNIISTIPIEVYKEPTYRSKIKVGNMTIYNENKFSWFNRFMMKLVFGWEVKNYK